MNTKTVCLVALLYGFAAAGYTAIAPSLFDRVRRGIQLGYSGAERQEGAGYVKQLLPENTMKDVAAAVAVVRNSGRVGTVGYCYGGGISYLAACQLPLACAVVYYGRAALEQTPKCPVLYHYGEADQSIPRSEVERLRVAAKPNALIYTYPGAGHGFSCDQRESYDAAAAALARTRSLQFLERYLAGGGSQ